MKRQLRSLLLSSTVLMGTLAFAQPVPPYSVTVMGTVSGCTPGSFVNIQTVQNTLPEINIDVPLSGNCFYATTLYMDSPVGNFLVSSPCGGAVQSDTGNYQINTFDSLFVQVNLNCGGPNFDCLGVPGGPAVPGSPCDDNNPATTNDAWSASCQCVGQQITNCNACFQIDSTGTPFTIATTNCTSGGVAPYTYLYDFGDGQTSIGEDVVHTYSGAGNYVVCMTMADANGCTSTTCDSVVVSIDGAINPIYYFDCLGVLNGPNTANTPCADPVTNEPGVWNYACACIADSSITVCNAGFLVIQAYDSTATGPEPIPNEVWIWNLSSGTSPYQFFWNFGDGTSSTDPYPTHFYASGGPYTLCLTMSDASNCTATYCDSVSVDANGIYNGIVGTPNNNRSGFTINVLQQLPTAIHEQENMDALELWPNPVSDAINISLIASHSSRLQLSVLDLNGRLVKSNSNAIATGNNRFSLPVNDLESGMYLLRISDGNNVVSRRFVKN